MTPGAVLVALGLLPMFREDAPGPEKAAQLSGIAHAVARRARDADEVAFVLAWGDAETHFSLRVHAGDCRPWQPHQNSMPEARAGHSCAGSRTPTPRSSTRFE